ncbi:MAG: VOC family protein [Acetobacteraceae bacterium]|nr:VOC family protein [Acetobacteraceae bacterium]
MSLVTADPAGSEAFYRDALGFERTGVEERAGGTRVTTLRLGRETVELVAFAEPSRPYPPDSASYDLWFQHFAIVVASMREAYARLRATGGWTAISIDGPQRLPESSGGVTAFKFRDPEGHPLELLEFPPDKAPDAWRERHAEGPCLGIDHSAIAVADTAASVRFYEGLGFAVSGRSLNQGAEQERLDNAPGAVVEVTALSIPGAPGPHLELLRYRHPVGRPAPPSRESDVACTRLVLESEGMPLSLRDPDAHEVVLLGSR